MTPAGGPDPRAVADDDALLLSELLGFRAQFRDSECDGSPLRIRDETGESEQTEANLRAVLWDAAERIKSLAAAESRFVAAEAKAEAAGPCATA